MINVDIIKQRLAEAIRTSEFSQTELAEMLHITQSSIAHYIRGDIMPSLDTFANLCTILDVSPAWILCYDDAIAIGGKNKKPQAGICESCGEVTLLQ